MTLAISTIAIALCFLKYMRIKKKKRAMEDNIILLKINSIVEFTDYAEVLRAPTPLLEDVEGQVLACPSD